METILINTKLVPRKLLKNFFFSHARSVKDANILVDCFVCVFEIIEHHVCVYNFPLALDSNFDIW